MLTSPAPTTVTARLAPAEQADDVAVTTLLNCHLRETLGGALDGCSPAETDAVDLLTLRLARLGLEIQVQRTRRSPTGQHAYRLPALLRTAPSAPAVPLDHVTLATLLGRELALSHAGDADLGGFVAAVVDSTRNVARFLSTGSTPSSPDGTAPGPTPFLRAEQSLRIGHPLHPAAKSRQPMDAEDVERYSPEIGRCFALHWFRAEGTLVEQDSAWERPAADILADLLVSDAEVDPALPLERWRRRGDALLPLHPLQARRLREHPAIRALLRKGRLADLGPQGTPWSPTSSLRTVYRASAPVMLKLSLAVRITNSVRCNLRKELARGAEVHRLLDAGLAAEIAERYPRFRVIRDPAWITLRAGHGESGFETVLRENPYFAGDTVDATVVAALSQPTPAGGPYRLRTLLTGLAAAEQRAVDDVARDWFRRYLTVVADPLLWLAGTHGIALEAHQQNGVVELEGGYPAGFRYRDNQGYYFKASHA
ncbi:MAG: hypothetical protein GEU81_15230, partial [Nitriliruptorales bacterium]|nr:hypothetical protein [Nitriliruptorales bacterium]